MLTQLSILNKRQDMLIIQAFVVLRPALMVVQGVDRLHSSHWAIKQVRETILIESAIKVQKSDARQQCNSL